MSKELQQAQRLDAFLSGLVDATQATESYEKVENAKRSAINEAMTVLTAEMKDSIREGMTFQLVDEKGQKQTKSFDERGQEYSIDTFGATKRGHMLSKSDQPKVQKAMNEIAKLVRKVIDKMKDLKKPDGTRVYPFDAEDDDTRVKAQLEFTTLIELEVFTPLVREGLIPENFVPDDFSEVQKLLDATFDAYRTTTKETKKEDARKRSDMRGMRLGIGGKLDMLAGIGGAVEQMQEKVAGQVMQRLNISKERGEELLTKFEHTKQKISTGIAFGRMGITLTGWVPDKKGQIKAIRTQEKLLNPSDFSEELPQSGPETEMTGVDITEDSERNTMSDDALRLELAQAKREEKIVEAFDYFRKTFHVDLSEEDVVYILNNYVDSVELYMGVEGTKALISVIADGIISLAIPGDKITKTQELLDGVSKEYEGREAAKTAVGQIDDAIAKGIAGTVSPKAGACFEGLFVDQIDLGALLENTSPNPDGEAVTKAIANAIKATFTAASPTLLPEDYDVFEAAGRKIAEAFSNATPGKEFKKNILNTPDSAFGSFVDEAKTAIKSGMTNELKDKLGDDNILRKITVKSVIPDEEKSLAEWRQSDEELREYERALVLLDDGGITAAEERSIEKLIAAMEKDKATLKLVTNIGSVLTGVGGGGVNLVNRPLDGLTDVVAGEIVGPLKAAKLIMKFACDVKRAADRALLLKKFHQNLQRSNKSVSSLSSTIQGFVNNKVEQIHFREIEMALTAVQIASAILGSIPEPHVLAIGKLLGACTSFAQEAAKLDEMIYNDEKLAEAWAVTKAAMANQRDRALGLAALRLNPTLGMHAIAWAGMRKTPPDPIARMFLDSVGLNEQTLAVSGTEKKVREYLQKLLYEDREMIDDSKIRADWAPETYRMCTKDWYVIVSRAHRDAVPQLLPGNEKAVLEALKKTDKHQLKKLEAEARNGTLKVEDYKKILEEAKALLTALEKFIPKALDGSVHVDMSSITDEFIKFATEHKKKLRQIGDICAKDKTDEKLKLLRDVAENFVTLFGTGKAPPHGTKPELVEEKVKNVELHINDVKTYPFIAVKKHVAEELRILTQYKNNAELWLIEQKVVPVGIEEIKNQPPGRQRSNTFSKN